MADMVQTRGCLSPSEAAAEHPAEGTTETVGAATRSTPGTEPRATGPGSQGRHTGEPLKCLRTTTPL